MGVSGFQPDVYIYWVMDPVNATVSASARFHLICGTSGNLYLMKFLKEDVEKAPGIPDVNFLPYIITFIVREREILSHFVPAF